MKYLFYLIFLPVFACTQENNSPELVNTRGLSYLSNYPRALDFHGRADTLFRKPGDRERITANLERQADIYGKIGYLYAQQRQYDSACWFQRLALQQYNMLLKIDKKNGEILKSENARDIRIITVTVIIVILLLVIVGWVAISRQRLKVRNEQLTREQDRHIYQTQRELMQAELQNRQLQEEKLVQELAVKRKGLTSSTQHVIQKNQLLEDLRNQLAMLMKGDKGDQTRQLQQLIRQINLNFNHDQYWNEFRETFEQVHQQFFDNLKRRGEELTANDLRLLALIKLNLDTADIATLLGISPDSLRVSRYRLKKKLALDAAESLTAFVESM